jgi:hypothetical protein
MAAYLALIFIINSRIQMPVDHAHHLLKVSLFKTCCLLFFVLAILSSCHEGSGRPDAGSPEGPVPFKKFEMDIQPLVLAYNDSSCAGSLHEAL